ncbi:hypothetical protein UFOVP37_8 [uncultured Caudovirales phage]|uniref:Uncharacterized protein n=1 Tax=uncultured Caudovirales phage TaxID=2100421 RepID=A0A6J5KQ93_9CAUD|nr:hypothetical protein UFOVP37_8 [uncultured Caudovirales phage]
MSKHTPGPWAMPDSGQGRISKVGANGGWDGLIATADCGDYARSRSEGLANARLIAAAPELLEALKDMLDGHEDACTGYGEGAADKARAAIARATGGDV